MLSVVVPCCCTAQGAKVTDIYVSTVGIIELTISITYYIFGHSCQMSNDYVVSVSMINEFLGINKVYY